MMSFSPARTLSAAAFVFLVYVVLHPQSAAWAQSANESGMVDFDIIYMNVTSTEPWNQSFLDWGLDPDAGFGFYTNSSDENASVFASGFWLWVYLNSPADGALIASNEVSFNCSAWSSHDLVNITLFGNWSGWHANETVPSSGTSYSAVFLKALPDGSYAWNCFFLVNSSNSTFASGTYAFTLDTLPPDLSAVEASAITQSSATILWGTGEPANSTVIYSGVSASDISLVSSHSIMLSGLSAGTQYSFNVSSCDAAGNCGFSGPFSFSTPAAAQVPAQTQPAVVPATSNPAYKVGSLSVNPGNNVVLVAINFNSALSDPGLAVSAVQNLQVPDNRGLVYASLNFTPRNFDDADVKDAAIDFRINKSWLLGNNITSVYLARYDGGWQNVSAELVYFTSNYGVYRASAEPSSYFAIIGVQAPPRPATQGPVSNASGAGRSDNVSVAAPEGDVSKPPLSQADIDGVHRYMGSVVPKNQRARELLENARVKLSESQAAFNNGDFKRAKMLLGAAEVTVDEAALAGADPVVPASSSAVSGKPLLFAIIFLLAAVACASHFVHARRAAKAGVEAGTQGELTFFAGSFQALLSLS